MEYILALLSLIFAQIPDISFGKNNFQKHHILYGAPSPYTAFFSATPFYRAHNQLLKDNGERNAKSINFK
jgi:hypothetical protein